MSTIAPTAAAEEASQSEEEPAAVPAVQADPSASLLDLSTLVERRTISIDGTAYELRNVAEFGIVESHSLVVKGRKVAGLGEFDSLSNEQAEQASRAIEDMMRLIVVDLPDDVLAKLSDHQRSMVIKTWKMYEDSPASPGVESDPTPAPTTQES